MGPYGSNADVLRPRRVIRSSATWERMMSSKNACVEGQEALNTYDIFLHLPGLTEIGLQQPIPLFVLVM